MQKKSQADATSRRLSDLINFYLLIISAMKEQSEHAFIFTIQFFWYN